MSWAQENQERIQAVQRLFAPAGRPLCQPGRVLIGEGRLMKLCRRGPRPKTFFLFNDVLVYGSVVLPRRWCSRQHVIPLEDIQLEDVEDSPTMKNQWLIKAPCKSFFMAAASAEEKEAWLGHIADCQSALPCRRRSSQPDLAAAWLPDQASGSCMRCSLGFSVTQRRHHCRLCGLLVCGWCSKYRAVIGHIHPTKRLRVCSTCRSALLDSATPEKHRQRRGSSGTLGSDGDQVVGERWMVAAAGG